MTLLTDEKIEQTIAGHGGKSLIEINKLSCIAQLKAVVEWGDELCPHTRIGDINFPKKRCECDLCWQALRREAFGEEK